MNWLDVVILSALEVDVDFNVNVLLCYLVKLHILERWYVLDPEKGAALFKSLVDEVRGTFGGIDMQDYMQTTKRRKTE